MPDTLTNIFKFIKPAAGKNNYNLDVDANFDAIDARLALHFRNLIINGDFCFWQRGPTANVNEYGPDRWESGGGGPVSISRQAGASTVPWKYSCRIQRNAGETHNSVVFGYGFKDLDVIPLRGKTVIFSVKIKKGANFSPASNNLTLRVVDSNSQSNQSFRFYGGNITDNVVQITSSNETYSVTHTIASDAIGLAVGFLATTTGTAGADDWFEIAEAQLEEGNIVTDFEYRPKALELSLCQEYYEKTYDLNVAPGTITKVGKESVGAHSLTGFFRHSSQFKTRKRVVPSVTTYSTGTGLAGKMWVANTFDVAPSLEDIGETGFNFYHNRTWDPSDFIWWHWTADAEL